MTDTIVERVARAVCDFYDELPEIATYLERKASTREWCDRKEVRETARSAMAATKYRDGTDEDRFIAAANSEKIDVVGLICAYDRVIDAALAQPE